MRWALRNQNQIKERLGEQFFQELKNSLNSYFKTHKTEDEYSQIPNIVKGYDIQEIPSISEPNKIHQFALIKRVYDVFNLAYYKTISKDEKEISLRT